MGSQRVRLPSKRGVLLLVLVSICALSCDRPPMTPTQRPGASPSAIKLETHTNVATRSPSPAPQATEVPSLTAPGSAVRQCVLARARYYTTIPTRYRLGSTGPTDFDCTGLVYRVFADCSVGHLIGTQGEQLVFDYYAWFSARGLADAVTPQEGDLIVYGLDFAHVAIYVGNGRAISALLDGVREHDALRLGSSTPGEIMPVKAYLHIQAK
jgi:cell wall-associated NlpC family hydrolase